MAHNAWSKPVSYSPFPYLDQPYEPRSLETIREDYPRLYEGPYVPTARALEAAATLSGAFFYFVQPRLWEDIADASNKYFEEMIDERVEGQYTRQVAREKKIPSYKRSTRGVLKSGLMQTPDIMARELYVFVGLLFARATATNQKKIENHWKTTNEGAIPRGLLGSFMTRDRFIHISRNLHFSSNKDPRATKDRSWKLRSVINTLPSRFQSSYIPPPVMSFDEAMLPFRSLFTRMRVYMKDKPHKW